MQLVEQIKQELDIVTALEKYTTADLSKLRGKKGNILCPFHQEKSPSFLVDTINNTWHCFGACGTGGDVISLYAMSHGVSNKDAVKMMGTELGFINSNTKLSKKAKLDFIKNKRKKEIVHIAKQDIEKTYNELCSTSHIVKNFINAASNMEEMDMIASVCDEDIHIIHLIDCLLNYYGKEEYLMAYVEAKGVVERWESILTI